MSTISYSRKGSGQPIVLIHGIGHRRTAWFDVYDRLAEQFDVIAIDLPGFGQSPPPAAPDRYAMLSIAEQLEGLFADLGLDRPHVVGNSLGGFLALILAARGSIASAVALSPAGFMGRSGSFVAGAVLIGMKAASRSPRPVLRLFAKKPALRRLAFSSLYVHPERLTPQVAYGDSINLRESPGFWPCFRQAVGLRIDVDPEVPVTVGWGDKDRLLLPRQAEVARRRLPHARHEPLPGCGHVPMLDDPDAVVRLVVETVERAETADHAGMTA